MSIGPRTLLPLALTLFACTPLADDGTADGESVADESGSTETGAETESESESESGGESESESGSETDGELTFEELEMMCAAQVDQASCEALPGIIWRHHSAYCAWFVEVPVELLGETCNFGVPLTGCVLEHYYDRSPAPELCGLGEIGWSRIEDDTIVVGRGEFYQVEPACGVDAEGNVTEGIPECKCLCDPGFPG